MPISTGVRWFARVSLMAVAIYIGSTYLIHMATTSPVAERQKTHQQAPLHQTGDAAQFRALLDSGNQALRSGNNPAATVSFQAAEHAIEPLDDEQYGSLKSARLQLAGVLETSGDTTGAEGVYRSVVECGNREARALWQAKQYERALGRAQDAEQLADHVDQNRAQLQAEARDLIAGSFDSLQRFSDEAEVQQREIDYLRSTADEYAPEIANSLFTLAQTYYKANHWSDMEQTLTSAGEACDRTLSRYSDLTIRIIVASCIRCFS